MEHQVFVPAPAELLRTALADQAHVARAVPGLQQDAGAEPITGRLKLRVGGHSVTYRGTARVTLREDGTCTVDADATEARGTGSVKLALTLRLTDTEGGCTVTAEGTADASGRITELPAEAVTAAATRLLNRFLEALATLGDVPPEPPPTPPAPPSSTPRSPVLPRPGRGRGRERRCERRRARRRSRHRRRTPRPLPRGLHRHRRTPAEAAHARRTMIGRSAEEVDHAPPRGRYAPVPAPRPSRATRCCAGRHRRRRWPWRPRSSWAGPCANAAEGPRSPPGRTRPPVLSSRE